MWVIFPASNSNSLFVIPLLLLSVTGLTMDESDGWYLDKPETGNVTETISHILKTYDIRLRPGFGGDSLYIGIEVLLDNFLKVSEVNMDYTITLYLNQYWKDERLAFSTNDEMLVLSHEFAERIWVPDTFFANDKQSFLHDVTEKNKVVRLHGDGSIMYGMRFTTTLSCNFDLHYYPLDQQNCTVEIESYGYTTRDVFMYWKGETDVGVDKVKPPQFIITAFDTNDRIVELATGAYQRLSLSFAMTRETSYFVFQTYLPSILIVMLSWISFWINHEVTAARVTLGITTVLTMTTLSSSVRASLPRISYVKAIDIYLVMCFVFVFAALLEFAAVNNFHWEKKLIKPPVPKTPKIEISKPKDSKSSKRSALEVVGLQGKERDKNVRRPAPPSSSEFGAGSGSSAGSDSDPLYTIHVLETDFQRPDSQISSRFPNFPSPSPLSRIPRSTSFSGLSGIVGPHPHNLLGHPNVGNVYVSPSVPPTSTIPKRPKVPWKQRKFVQTLRKNAKAVEKLIPNIRQDVNIIDKFSRVAFPLSFIIFNIVYWGFYHDWNGT